MKILNLDLPNFWANVLINGDVSGMSDEDEAQLDAFVADMVNDYGKCWCLFCGEETSFKTWHDARSFGVLACNTLEFHFDVTPDKASEEGQERKAK